MIDLKNHQLFLIDWGIAEFYIPGKQYEISGTPNWRSPDALMDYEYTDYTIDIWKSGMLLAGLIAKQVPFFTVYWNDPRGTLIEQML